MTVETAAKTMTINMGPQHPSTHGVLRLVLELEGETVRKITPVIGYLHTGMEKICEAKRYQQAVPVTDRMDYMNPLGNNLAYVMSVEKLMGWEIPPRAVYIRTLFAELTRLNSHLVWLATHALDMGAMTVFLYCWREREKLLDLFEMVSGQRMMTTYFRIGGLMKDLPSGLEKKCKELLDEMPERIDEYEGLLTKNPIWRRRTMGVGKISGEDAVDLGLTGPSLRASGVPYDVRKATPYLIYDKLDFEISGGTVGDVYDRYLCRLFELRESTKICQQVLAGIPAGPVMVDDPKLWAPPKEVVRRSMESLIHHFIVVSEGFPVPAGEAYVPLESPKGEIGFYVVSDGSNKPYRVKVRPPCFVNLQSISKMAEGQLVADVVAIIGSIDIVLGEVDR
jgi:NADH-quinone oxidoreductase subunit D